MHSYDRAGHQWHLLRQPRSVHGGRVNARRDTNVSSYCLQMSSLDTGVSVTVIQGQAWDFVQLRGSLTAGHTLYRRCLSFLPRSSLDVNYHTESICWQCLPDGDRPAIKPAWTRLRVLVVVVFYRYHQRLNFKCRRFQADLLTCFVKLLQGGWGRDHEQYLTSKDNAFVSVTEFKL